MRIAIALLCVLAAQAGEVRIAVFGLFHPRHVDVIATAEPGEVILRVPGRIERRFRGRVELLREGGEVLTIVTMEVETAVASIVAAESSPGAGIESLKAQAVVARSYLTAAHGRHKHSDFCDTTHCQYLREPPAPTSAAWRAAHETQGLALVYDGRVFPALYSADCGGHTRITESAGVPYFGVECPVRSRAPAGHRLGLCQAGSAAMARDGLGFVEILRHYFPAAGIGSTSGPTRTRQKTAGAESPSCDTGEWPCRSKW